MPSNSIGVLLLNLGGPDTTAAVRPFLYNLFSDRKIIPLGPAFMQRPLAWLISTRRAKKSAGYYKQIGGGSPLLEITTAQGQALETRMREHGDFRVFVGMRYWKPYIKDTVAIMHAQGITKVIGLSLYPQYSIATTGSSEDALSEALEQYPMEVANIKPWYSHPGYIEALAELIAARLKEGTLVIFSAHSLPKSFIEGGDPYQEHTLATIEAISQKVKMDYRVGYQSRSGPVEWLTPPTEEVIQQAAKDGYREILMVPISFVSDHIETLYEIDILYRGIAEGLGMAFSRTDSLNTHPLFIRTLEDLTLKEARNKGWAQG